MSDNAVTFGHVELSCDAAAVGRPCFSFRSIKNRPFPLFTLQPLQANGDCAYMAVAADPSLEGTFHLVGCRRAGGTNSYTFIQVDDVLDLKSELNRYGVSDAIMASWNARHPEEALFTAAAAQAAASVLGRYGRKPGAQPE